MARSAGIHHITAIAGEPKRHVAFYSRALGLRFVKRTVNFDDPGTWHFYFGDEIGSPGSALTFFLWENVPPGKHGARRSAGNRFRHSRGLARILEKASRRQGCHGRGENAARRNRARLRRSRRAQTGNRGVEDRCRNSRLGRRRSPGRSRHPRLSRRDARTAVTPSAPPACWWRFSASTRSAAKAIASASSPRTARSGASSICAPRPALAHASQGIGTVHHVAFRAADDAAEMAMRERALKLGLQATEQVDRLYFRSVYFREPGGVCSRSPPTSPASRATSRRRSSGAKSHCRPGDEIYRRAEIRGRFARAG